MGAANVDRDLLHTWLWERTDRHRTIKIANRALAADLGMDEKVLWRVLKRMVDEGRIRKIATAKLYIPTWLVIDPDMWIEQWHREHP